MKEKVRKEDFSKNELPHTRWGVFWDLVKHQKRQMVSLSMLLFVFLLPLAVDIIIFNLFIMATSMSGQDPEVVSSTIFSLIFYMMIIAIPCSMIGFVGLGGLSYTCRNIVWQEGVLPGPDFFIGIKKNYKHSLILGLIWSISLFLLVVGILFLLRTMPAAEIPWIHSVGIGVLIVQFIVISIVFAYCLTYTTYYENKFRIVFRNSFIFFTARFLKNLLLFIFTTGLVVGLMFVDFIAQIIVIVLLAFISSYMMVGWTLLSHSAYDQFINKDNYPEFYKKGLYIEEPKEE